MKTAFAAIAMLIATSTVAVADEPQWYCAPEGGLPWEVVTIPFGYAIVDANKATYCTVRDDNDFFSCNGAYQTSFRLSVDGDSITLTSLDGKRYGYLEKCEEGEPKAPYGN